MLRTDCPTCEQSVGLLNDYRGPNSFPGRRKRTIHKNPKLPRLANGRAQRCAGSSIEVDEFAIYEVEGTSETLRKHRAMEKA